MSYQAVLFDMDGVIVDSEPLHVAAFQATLKSYGHDLCKPTGGLPKRYESSCGMNPADCIVIEDTPKGVQTAGIRCLAATNTHAKEELADATLIVDQLKPGYIESL